MTNAFFISVLSCTLILTSMVHAENTQDPDVLFKQALELRNSGHVYSAIEMFESIITLQPGLHRARLELAISYHNAELFEQAKKQLVEVFNEPDTPEIVKLTITSYLAQLGRDEQVAQQRISTKTHLSAGLFTDSNINLAPNSELPNISTEKRGNGIVALASYSHISHISKPLRINNKPYDFEWRSLVTAYSKIYSGDENDFDLQLISLRSGPILINTNKWQLGFKLKFDKINYSGNPYAFYIGLNPFFILNMKNHLNITFESKWTAREYSTFTDLEGVSKMYGLSIDKFLTDYSFGLHAGARFHSNGAQNESLNYRGTELLLGSQINVWENGHIFIQTSLKSLNYKVGTGGAEARDETESNSSLGISHKFTEGPVKFWKINALLTHSNNDSNIASFKYERDVIELNLSKTF